jgi:hypothetical protein
MEKCIQENPRNVSRSLYHHGLVKILLIDLKYKL